ncbi:MAG TPA: hypothetical protein VKB46_10975 [Pyrinomonadaceae bacterium]|nr:hypothetical protein [Pyrinomonadaceae bacterium]
MLFFIGFALIGIVAGLIAEKFVSDKRVPHNPRMLVWLGLVGALAGGTLSLALFRYGRASVNPNIFPYGGTREMGQASVPADWLSLIVAMLGAALVIACYKLVKVLRRGD